MPTVLGIDLSLTSTGLAVVRDGQIQLITRVSTKGKKDDTLPMRRARLNSIGGQVMNLVVETMPALVVIEAPSMGSQHGHPHDRSGLWWLLVNRIMADGFALAQVPPTCRAKYGTGKGNAPKDLVLTDVVRRYAALPSPVTKNDEADALLLAAMGSRQLGAPVEDSLPATHLAAMGGVVWP